MLTVDFHKVIQFYNVVDDDEFDNVQNDRVNMDKREDTKIGIWQNIDKHFSSIEYCKILDQETPLQLTKKYRMKHQQYKCVLLGDCRTGKSSLVIRFIKGHFSRINVVVAFLTQTIKYNDD